MEPIAEQQYYLGPSTVGMSECAEVFFEEVKNCLDNYGKNRLSILENSSWYNFKDPLLSPKDQSDIYEMISYFYWFLKRKYPEADLSFYIPEHDSKAFQQILVPEDKLDLPSTCQSERLNCPCCKKTSAITSKTGIKSGKYKY